MGGKLRVTKAQAKGDVTCVESYLRDGCPPVGQSGGTTSALVLAAHDRGVPVSTMHSRIGSPTHKGIYYRLFKLEPDWSLFKGISPKYQTVALAPRSRMGGTDHDTQIVHLNDEIKRLKTALHEAHRNRIDDEQIRQILAVMGAAEVHVPHWVTTPPAPKAKTPEAEVPMTIWSDWHMGEVVDKAEVNGINEYSPGIAAKRVERLVDATCDLAFNHHSGNYPGIVVNLLGDFVSGGLHPELLKTDEEEVIPSALRARDLLVGGLKKIADRFGNVYCPCACGNHGRATPKPEHKRYVYQNFDWLIYQLLIREFADDPRIRISIRPSNDIYYRVFNLRFLAVHGDQLGVKGGDGIIGALGPIARGEIKSSRQSSAFGNDYDYLLMGHWHQELWLPRAIVANALKGFDQYASNVLKAVPSKPSQPLWFVHPKYGITAKWNVFVEKDQSPKSAAWISWPEDV